ncbi:MAG: WhiB family transcriptional regulator [Actinomycetota bacterium]|nr:WhiB family transcriptional regulator [Actinomycetota bacterium]
MSWSLTYREWQYRAACRGPLSMEFYPPATGERRDQKQSREERAKSICGNCPVNQECLDYALTGRELHGIWGGTTETERREIIGLSV